MKKNIKIILFFILVVIATFITSYFAEAAKVIGFIEDQKEIYNDDYNFLIQKTIIANYQDKTNAYVLNEPLYNNTLKNNNSHLDFTIKSFVSFKNETFSNGLAFIIKDVFINDVDVELDDHDTPIIDVKIYYEPSFIYNETNFSYSQETFIPILDTKIALFFIDYEILLDNNKEYVEITQIDFFYRTNEQKQLLFELKKSIDENSLNNLTIANIMLKETTNMNYLNNNLIYFNNELLKKYNSFNSYYFKYLFIEAIIIVVLGYFSFFHKLVMKNYAFKKMEKKKTYEKLKEQIEKEHNTND